MNLLFVKILRLEQIAMINALLKVTSMISLTFEQVFIRSMTKGCLEIHYKN